MEECTKCKSRDIRLSERKTSAGHLVQVVFCTRCKTETRVTYITDEK